MCKRLHCQGEDMQTCIIFHNKRVSSATKTAVKRTMDNTVIDESIKSTCYAMQCTRLHRSMMESYTCLMVIWGTPIGLTSMRHVRYGGVLPWTYRMRRGSNEEYYATGVAVSMTFVLYSNHLACVTRNGRFQLRLAWMIMRRECAISMIEASMKSE